MKSYGKLTWEFTPLAKTVNFLDLTLEITKTGIKMSLFKKKLKIEVDSSEKTVWELVYRLVSGHRYVAGIVLQS